MTIGKKNSQPSGRVDNMAPWGYRRRITNITLILCAAGVGYIIGWGQDNLLHRAVAEALVALYGAVVLGYIDLE